MVQRPIAASRFRRTARFRMYPDLPFLDRGPAKPALHTDGSVIWSIDPAGLTREIGKRPPGEGHLPIVMDVDPSTDAALIATPEGIARLDDDGRLEPLPGVRKSETGLSTRSIPCRS